MIKFFIGLTLLFPVFLIDLLLWIFGGWTKGSLLNMPAGEWVYNTFLK